MALNISLAEKIDEPQPVSEPQIQAQPQPQPQAPSALTQKIKVIGVGGAGGNAVDNMIRNNVGGVDFILCNTDRQALDNALASHKLGLGGDDAKGLGTGAKPEYGARAANESIDDIQELLQGTQLLFLTAGMGGGTGTGATPMIAKIANEMGILTAAIVTKPFQFEGEPRAKAAKRGIKKLAQYVDTLVVIDNQKLFDIADETTTLSEAFQMTDNVLASGIRGVTDLMTVPGIINLDFSDIATIMGAHGRALIGTGEAEGDNRAVTAAKQALSHKLLDDVDIRRAQGILINVTGGNDLGLVEMDRAVTMIRGAAPQDAQLIFGASASEEMQGRIRITILATGIEAAPAEPVRDDSGEAFADNRIQAAPPQALPPADNLAAGDNRKTNGALPPIHEIIISDSPMPPATHSHPEASVPPGVLPTASGDNLKPADSADAALKIEQLRAQIHCAHDTHGEEQNPSDPNADHAVQNLAVVEQKLAQLQNAIGGMVDNISHAQNGTPVVEAAQEISAQPTPPPESSQPSAADMDEDTEEYDEDTLSDAGKISEFFDDEDQDNNHAAQDDEIFDDEPVPPEPLVKKRKTRLSFRKKQDFGNQARPETFSLPFDDSTDEAEILAEAEAGAKLLNRKELDIPAFLRRQAN